MWSARRIERRRLRDTLRAPLQALTREARGLLALELGELVPRDPRPELVAFELLDRAGAGAAAGIGAEPAGAALRLATAKKGRRVRTRVRPNELRDRVEHAEQQRLVQQVDQEAVPAGPGESAPRRLFRAPARQDASPRPGNEHPARRDAGQHHSEPGEDRHVVVRERHLVAEAE